MPRSMVAIIITLILFIVSVPITFGQRSRLFNFGVNVGELNPATVKAVKYLNADSVRMAVFSWDLIEPEKDQFDFTVSDRSVALAKENNLTIVGVLHYTPVWASGLSFKIPEELPRNCGIPQELSEFDILRNTPPKDPKDFGDFVAVMAARYPEVQYWQIWNEPNSAMFWRPKPNAAAYAALLKEGYTAAKKANPNARIVLGGLSLNDLGFLDDIHRAGGTDYFDIMAVHLYNIVQSPNQYLANEIQHAYNFMQARGIYNKPIWITEIGWPTSDGNISIDQGRQATYLEEAYRIAQSFDFVTGVFWHTIVDCPTDLQKDNPEHNYGLFDGSWLPKFAARSYRFFIRQ